MKLAWRVIYCVDVVGELAFVYSCFLDMEVKTVDVVDGCQKNLNLWITDATHWAISCLEEVVQ